jgi:hypothetical protein
LIKSKFIELVKKNNLIMANAAMSIGQQMHEFQNTVSSIESQYNSMIVTAGEMINDLNFG